jgi:two-component system sporulation sensor kinase B
MNSSNIVIKKIKNALLVVNMLRTNNQRVLNLEKIESIPYLSSALAHEIRNPMTAVKGFLQLITSGEFNDEKKKEYALIAISEIDRAESILRDFLTWSKQDFKYLKNINLNDEISKVLSILQSLANLNRVQMSFCSKTAQFIQGESSLVQQFLINLCKNAIEAMDQGGILTIRTWDDSEYLYMEVEDTGAGMSEEELFQLGKPFFTTKGEKGTGLGLMLTYNIVKNMKGTIQVMSDVGMGTTFLLTFPIQRQ